MNTILSAFRRCLRSWRFAKTDAQEFAYWAYRVILLREPESHEVVSTLAARAESEHDMRNQLITCPEARGQAGFPVLAQAMTGNEEVQIIEAEVSDEDRQQLFNKVQQVWQRLGETAAYWSVATHDKFLPENIDNAYDDFYSTGAENVHTLLSTLSRNQIAVANLKTCIDFGCGVGRLSVALAAQFDQVTAVDVSASHLAIANQVFTKRHISNVATLHLAQITDVHTLPCVDLIYSVIVLQHNPPPVIRYLLCALFGRLNPGGVAVIQLPTYLPKGYRFVANEYLVNGGTGMEMHALPQRVIFRDARTSGIDVLEVLEDSWTGYGVGSCSNTFVFQRPAA